MSKSKETIANEILGKRPVSVDIEWDEVLECMSAYGKEIAIGFAEWVDENYFGLGVGMFAINIGEIDEQKFTTKELFEKYLQTLKP